jgi:hypothetical protein
MAGKPFSPELYSNDDNAKDLLIALLDSNGWKAWVNPDQYGIDVLSTDPYGDDTSFEVEVKHNWKGPKFQYDTLHYSDRKRKFLKDPHRTFFVTFNHERTHAMIVPGLLLAAAPTIIKNTIYTNNEKFIEVKASECALIDLGEPLEEQW